jgi:hypothetical protein
MVRERTGVAFVAVVISASMISVVSASARVQTKIARVASFPISTKSASYILAATLQVGGRTLNGNVSASNVTIDLHGFSIIGPGSGVGVGINAGGANNVTVENDSVTNIGGSGSKWARIASATSLLSATAPVAGWAAARWDRLHRVGMSRHRLHREFQSAGRWYQFRRRHQRLCEQHNERQFQPGLRRHQ